jgi:hypothetical protein
MGIQARIWLFRSLRPTYHSSSRFNTIVDAVLANGVENSNKKKAYVTAYTNDNNPL